MLINVLEDLLELRFECRTAGYVWIFDGEKSSGTLMKPEFARGRPEHAVMVRLQLAGAFVPPVGPE
jgi:hypothetical protein